MGLCFVVCCSWMFSTPSTVEGECYSNSTTVKLYVFEMFSRTTFCIASLIYMVQCCSVEFYTLHGELCWLILCYS